MDALGELGKKLAVAESLSVQVGGAKRFVSRCYASKERLHACDCVFAAR